jgi:hypothetical protein
MFIGILSEVMGLKIFINIIFEKYISIKMVIH